MLVDIDPTKLSPTQRNRHMGEDNISRRLDIFLVGEGLVSSLEMIWKWVECGGELDHSQLSWN